MKPQIRRSNTTRLIDLIIVALSVLLAGFSPAENTSPTPEQIKRVTSFVQSPQASQRAAAYKACRARGYSFKDQYFELLVTAERYHAQQLQAWLNSQTDSRTPLGKAAAAWENWQQKAAPALEWVLTDHQKDKSKFATMDQLYAEAAALWEKVRSTHKQLEKSGGNAGLGIAARLTALREIHMEKAWCRPDDFFEDEIFDVTFIEKELGLTGEATQKLKAAEDISRSIEHLAATHEVNDEQKWASATQKEFARILNDRRAVLGLQPLRIEEKLSDACIGHSKEMSAMSYFSHTSPVEKNRSFDMRARNAGFTGSPGGECIFSGSTSAAAAESAWWYSDGHRLINYSRGPNTLGIGPVGTMWTLNVGSMNWE